MKAFGLFNLKNTTEPQPTITKRGLYLKEKMHVEKRYRKKHEIKDYQNYLGVNALALAKPPDSNLYRSRISNFKIPRPSLVVKPMPTAKLVKSNTQVLLTVRPKPFKFKGHKESPKVSSRIKVPLPVTYYVEDNDDFEPHPCRDFASPVPILEVIVNFKLIQEEI